MNKSGSDTRQVLAVRNLSPSGYVLRIEKKDINFKPGQCANLGLRGSGINREYSLYGGDKDPYLEFLIREVENGRVSSALRQLKPGDDVEFDGCYGMFLLEKPEDLNRKYVFIGSGTGIAPYRSFVRSYPKIDYTILHGIRDIADNYDANEYAPGRYISCTSRSDKGTFKGRVTDYLREHTLDVNAYYYLCGNRGMISEAYDVLREKDVSGDQIIMEVFF